MNTNTDDKTKTHLEPREKSVLDDGGRFFLIHGIVHGDAIDVFRALFPRLISHPLVKLNEMAKRLARLDFSVRTEMRRQDEIGELAATFDYLATELNGMMGELQAANEQLQRDIEKEKQQELLPKRFVANVSHELKTPVSLIQGYAEALRDNVGQGAKRHKYASVIVNEAERMSRLVKDLLDLSQLESGRFDLWWRQPCLDPRLEPCPATSCRPAIRRPCQCHPDRYCAAQACGCPRY
ncbi:HAMP domain-containing histidine kinase [Paenibacillus melissococcoides]|uniref:histidine kinase n=1 Tax=Paenibacillus melissococcoides TaxID=2912268 RepID=A0ABN8U1T7_9BACL|nr:MULTISPECIES: HAMP domain-containing sensor histidine kinase [Paenibacillus]MEB9897762.1 HAMP domain-containing sensor histidine kinase [Bacillus cereus]CAH8245035.1 HAMP domain-containing histidine kinase [Paenibacillus melissococcoides]CAH8709710.1 HAMP domain-containing histidine kinase [Paenibacillus melissococcoides]CAH8710436.1 HAMP domain-containing histidine kinase [Paenibacillus melissococcoides]GIO81115.1 hypothetical protein J6TS7_47250 [Paenibacillus dendritiformis]